MKVGKYFLSLLKVGELSPSITTTNSKTSMEIEGEDKDAKSQQMIESDFYKEMSKRLCKIITNLDIFLKYSIHSHPHSHQSSLSTSNPIYIVLKLCRSSGLCLSQ